MEDLGGESLEYETVGEFLVDLKKEFGRGDNEMMKIAELKKIKQGNRIIEKFVQESRRVVRRSEYKERLLMKKLKWEINGII